MVIIKCQKNQKQKTQIQRRSKINAIKMHHQMNIKSPSRQRPSNKTCRQPKREKARNDNNKNQKRIIHKNEGENERNGEKIAQESKVDSFKRVS